MRRFLRQARKTVPRWNRESIGAVDHRKPVTRCYRFRHRSCPTSASPATRSQKIALVVRVNCPQPSKGSASTGPIELLLSLTLSAAIRRQTPLSSPSNTRTIVRIERDGRRDQVPIRTIRERAGQQRESPANTNRLHSSKCRIKPHLYQSAMGTIPPLPPTPRTPETMVDWLR